MASKSTEGERRGGHEADRFPPCAHDRDGASLETMTIGDLEVAYRAAGEGRPVVFVHGLAEDHRTWAAQQEALTGYRTIAYDFRGHGRTTLGNADGTLAQLGGDLIGLLEQIGPATCVGFSLGGTIVPWAAAGRPDLVRDAVLLGTSSIVGRAAVAFYEQRIELVRSGDREGIAQALLEDTANAVANPDVDVQAAAAARIEAIGDGGGYCNAAAAMAALHAEPLTPRLAELRCRVLVVSGENDVVCPRKAADVMLAALPDATHVELPDVGHLMNSVDAPALVTEVVKDFLEEGDA